MKYQFDKRLVIKIFQRVSNNQSAGLELKEKCQKGLSILEKLKGGDCLVTLTEEELQELWDYL